MTILIGDTVTRIYSNVIGKIPTRLNLGIMMFMSCFVSYMLRVNMSINILAMIEPNQNLHEKIIFNFNETNDNVTTTLDNVPDYGPRYGWTAHEQSLLLGSYFWGYLITLLPAAMIAKVLGETNVIGFSMGLSAVFTALCPLAASIHFWAFFFVRLILGVLGGVLFPCLHSLISKWAPPDEKGKFVSSLMGGSLGTIVTWPLAGLIVETIGWIYAFYIPAVFTMCLTALWFFLVADSPKEHSRITVEERDYIEKSLSNMSAQKSLCPPLLSVAGSVPFWALLLLHYGNLWGLNFLLTAAPKFMNEILGFKLAKAGILASLPYLARMSFGFVFGLAGDYIRRKNVLSVTVTRKSFCIFSHILPGVLLIGLSYVGYHPYWCVTIITFSLGFNGASTMTNLQNAQDLAPNYAGTIYGFINFVGTTTGFITPLLVAYFADQNSTIEDWKNIFVIGGSVYILPAIIFMLFGSGKVQKWNDIPKAEEVSIKAA